MAWGVSQVGGGTTGGKGPFGNASRGVPSSQITLLVPATLAASFTLQAPPQIVGYSRASLTLGSSCSLYARGGEDPLSTAELTFPALSGVAYGGATATNALPALTLTASGTVQATGRVNATLPMLTLSASGNVGGLGAANLSLVESYALSARTGAQMRGGLTGAYSVNGTGNTGAIGQARLTLLNAYVLTARATGEGHGRAEMTLPALGKAPGGSAWLVGPHLSLQAVAHEVVAVSYEAYAINLTTGAVTHYTNYPFDTILRFGQDFFGVASTGLYRIGGSLDVNQAIDAHVKTFQTKFGSTKMKRVPYVYSSGRSDGGVRVGVTADEGTTYDYESQWGEVTGATNHRTKVGNGLRGMYYSFDISNIDGSSLELDSLDVVVAQSERAI